MAPWSHPSRRVHTLTGISSGFVRFSTARGCDTHTHTHTHRPSATSVTIGRILCFALRCGLKTAIYRGSRSDRPRYYTPHALDTVAAAGLGRTPRRTSCRASSQLMTSQWKSRPTITAHRSILIGRRSRYSITRVPHILH